jgi:hypothetical protein
MKQKLFFKLMQLGVIMSVLMMYSLHVFAQRAKHKTGFVKIFDGKTLTGWEGDTTYWRVENGNLVGEITPATLLKANSFIIWQGGTPADFVERRGGGVGVDAGDGRVRLDSRKGGAGLRLVLHGGVSGAAVDLYRGRALWEGLAGSSPICVQSDGLGGSGGNTAVLSDAVGGGEHRRVPVVAGVPAGSGVEVRAIPCVDGDSWPGGFGAPGGVDD